MAEPNQSRADQATAILNTYATWIDQYRGGMSREFAATIMLWESGGNFNAPGDPSLGEVGFYQVAQYVPAEFGLPPEARNDPEGNVCIGLAEYGLENLTWYLFLPSLIARDSRDAWMLARLSFAIGRGGSQQLASMAAASSPGDVFGDIVRYVTANGAPALGSQSGAKVQQRVVDILTQMQIADLVGPNLFGPPMFPPPPPGVDSNGTPYDQLWTPPPQVAPYYSQPFGWDIWLGLGLVAGAAYFLFGRRS